MPEETPGLNPNQTDDAQRLAEDIALGKEKALDVDVSSDYEASKQFAVSDIDRSGEGAEAAEEATAPKYELHEPEQAELTAESTGNPDDYLGMAKDVTPTTDAVTSVSDELLDKALDMGKPGQ